MSVLGARVDDETRKLLTRLKSEGRTAVLVSLDDQLIGILGISDPIRGSARDMVHTLKETGLKRIVMLTGDDRLTAESIARQAGIEEVQAGLLPEDKLAFIRRLQQGGHVVAMVGDGINDAPALAAADIGIAMGAAGADIALETADIALMSDDLGKIPVVIRLARKSLRVIKENIVFAIIFNTVLVFLSAQGWMTMILGAVLHQASSLLVILNSMRLLRRNV